MFGFVNHTVNTSELSKKDLLISTIFQGDFEVKIDISGTCAELMTGEESSRRAANKKMRKQALKIANDNLAMLIDEWRKIDAERG